jgi:hypothetical protein
VYKDFIRKLQGKTQLGKYRFGQDDNINTEQLLRLSPTIGFCVPSLFTTVVQRFSEKLGATRMVT